MTETDKSDGLTLAECDDYEKQFDAIEQYGDSITMTLAEARTLIAAARKGLETEEAECPRCGAKWRDVATWNEETQSYDPVTSDSNSAWADPMKAARSWQVRYEALADPDVIAIAADGVIKRLLDALKIESSESRIRQGADVEWWHQEYRTAHDMWEIAQSEIERQAAEIKLLNETCVG